MDVRSLFLILITTAAISDLLTRRIPNPLSFTLLASGMVVSVLGWVSVTWIDSVLGVFTAFGILLLPFALRVYQGGDVKLCMGMGAWLGSEATVWLIALGAVGGGVLAILMKFSSRHKSKRLTIPMAVSFACAGYMVHVWGVPPW